MLGCLDDIPSWDSQTAVTPVVGRVADFDVTTLVPQPDEVARVFSVPLGELTDPVRWTGSPAEWRGLAFTQYSFAWDGERLFGLSAFITLQLLTLMPGVACPMPDLERSGNLLNAAAKPHDAT